MGNLCIPSDEQFPPQEFMGKCQETFLTVTSASLSIRSVWHHLRPVSKVRLHCDRGSCRCMSHWQWSTVPPVRFGELIVCTCPELEGKIEFEYCVKCRLIWVEYFEFFSFFNFFFFIGSGIAYVSLSPHCSPRPAHSCPHPLVVCVHWAFWILWN